MGTGIALLFHDRGSRSWWVVSSTPRPHFTTGKGPVPILEEAGWTQGPVWTGGTSRPHRDSIPDHPSRSQTLYRLSYRAHKEPRYFRLFTKYGQHNGENVVRLPAQAKIFLFFKASRTALEPTQTTIEYWSLYPCDKGAGVWNWLLTSIDYRD